MNNKHWLLYIYSPSFSNCIITKVQTSSWGFWHESFLLRTKNGRIFRIIPRIFTQLCQKRYFFSYKSKNVKYFCRTRNFVEFRYKNSSFQFRFRRARVQRTQHGLTSHGPDLISESKSLDKVVYKKVNYFKNCMRK